MLSVELMLSDPLTKFVFGYEKTVFAIFVILPASILWFCTDTKSTNRKNRPVKKKNRKKSSRATTTPTVKKVEHTERISIRGDEEDDGGDLGMTTPGDVTRQIDATQNHPETSRNERNTKEPKETTPPDPLSGAKIPRPASADRGQLPPKVAKTDHKVKSPKKKKRIRHDTADVPASYEERALVTKCTQDEELLANDLIMANTQDDDEAKKKLNKKAKTANSILQTAEFQM
ncbi:hypothetical protein M3Y97_00790000 [Aphelenchoides bicaudatus]|nr:hypothetical protein M3Y97_00790000 [Aphelenchoides bicaudatus]